MMRSVLACVALLAFIGAADAAPKSKKAGLHGHHHRVAMMSARDVFVHLKRQRHIKSRHRNKAIPFLPDPTFVADDRFPQSHIANIPHRSAHYMSLREGAHREIRVAAATIGNGRPAAWCGWWLGHHLGMPRRDLWLARNWAHVGSNAGGPRVGAIVVWSHHVGIITGRAGSEWVVKSGNDGHAVRERPRSIAGAIAFRTLYGRA
jgi:hypothetical protein